MSPHNHTSQTPSILKTITKMPNQWSNGSVKKYCLKRSLGKDTKLETNDDSEKMNKQK